MKLQRNSYRTVKQKACIQVEEKKSIFLGICQPLLTEIEALAFVNSVRKEYPDATHHVYAWLLGGQQKLQRHSDDGEPQGTAGLPVFEVLRKSGVENAGLVVVRYFGGVHLGAGGLVRAYSKTASLALQEAQQITMQLYQRFRVIVGYADFERLRFRLQQENFWLAEVAYDIDVELIVGTTHEHKEQLYSSCYDETGGAALLELIDEVYAPVQT